jgi:hypothetical protein
MASGDTIPGQVRLVLEDAQGNRNIVLGAIPQNRVDYFNNDTQPDERLYINATEADSVTAPAGSQKKKARDAVFEAGEKLIVQHKSNSDNGRSIDHDAGGQEIEGVEFDLNRQNAFTRTLTVSDQELSGTTAESASEFVDMYRFTVPDRTRFFVAGSFESVAVEN